MTYHRRSDGQRLTMLDEMLLLSGLDKTDDITPIAFEAFVNARVKRFVKQYGRHLDTCVVLTRWRNDDGTRCDCGFRAITGGRDGEPQLRVKVKT